MITLSEKSKRIFVRVSDTALTLLFTLLVIGFFFERSGLEHALAQKFITGAIVLVLLATPVRLLVIALLFFKERQRQVAWMTLSLIGILLLGSLLKWFLL